LWSKEGFADSFVRRREPCEGIVSRCSDASVGSPDRRRGGASAPFRAGGPRPDVARTKDPNPSMAPGSNREGGASGV
jgi:hypothetical protein